MSRNFFIQAHLLVAALFTPILLLMVFSGGLYLLGVKGEVVQSTIAPPPVNIDLASNSLEDDVRKLLAEIDPSYAFEYLKVKGNTLYTRPTSKAHYEIKISGGGIEIMHNQPSLQKSLVELHKGHGPRHYKTLQKLMAAGFLFVLLSGMWLGLSSRILRFQTISMLLIGTVVASTLALV